jgi:uncharacterized protein YciI
MAFMIYSVDKPDSKHIRDEHRAAHYAFLEAHKHLLLASGGLQNDAGDEFIGSVILLDVDTRADAQDFVDQDPFTKAGLAQSLIIERWKKAFLNGQRI